MAELFLLLLISTAQGHTGEFIPSEKRPESLAFGIRINQALLLS